ncbi:MAG TPA: hypothetical protein VI231_22235 [Candidatus Binatia bacterium]|jgi:hypothetical protein
MATKDTTDNAPAHAREYLTRIGQNEESILTAGQIIGLLEYFGAVPTPADHAPTPHTDAEAYEEANAKATATSSRGRGGQAGAGGDVRAAAVNTPNAAEEQAVAQGGAATDASSARTRPARGRGGRKRANR